MSASEDRYFLKIQIRLLLLRCNRNGAGTLILFKRRLRVKHPRNKHTDSLSDTVIHSFIHSASQSVPVRQPASRSVSQLVPITVSHSVGHSQSDSRSVRHGQSVFIQSQPQLVSQSFCRPVFRLLLCLQTFFFVQV